ncbi:MAG: sulfatase-like hydrolase/transferase, partial [Verrucomicrobiota bacterium]
KDWPEPEKGFAAMLKNIDRDAGRILDLLKELKIDEKTLVIFSSDNGPHQEGGHKADFFNSNGKFRGMKRDLYEGGIRVPTIARWPGKIEAGSENDHAWYFGDFLATYAELSEAQLPDDGENLDSESFAQTLVGNPREKQWGRTKRLYWEFYERGSAQAVRFGKWKAIRKPMHTGPIELYDLSHDFGEEQDYAKRRPDLVEHAENLMAKEHVPLN